jgi:hypothetical protein
MGAALFTSMGYFEQLRPSLDGAWSGHDDQLLSAKGHPTHGEDCIFRFKLAAGRLIGLGNGHDILYPIHTPNLPPIHNPTIANNANHGSIRPDNGMHLAAGFLYSLDNGVDIFLAGFHLHHHDHVTLSSLNIRPADLF